MPQPAFLHPILRSGKDVGHDKELKPRARFPFHSDKGYEGEVQVNGWVRDTELFNQQSCYVMQDDCLLPEITVREALTMSVQLRMPSLDCAKRTQLVGGIFVFYCSSTALAFLETLVFVVVFLQ